MKILIVDDDEDSRGLLQRFLTLLGHEVVAAENGEKAWDLVKTLEIRFVISDWMMPVMNGLELCQRIRSADLPFYCYVMLLTAKGTKEALIEGMSAGADDFLAKPFNREELEVRVHAGERVVGLEQKLLAQQTKVQQAYTKLSLDLEAAAQLQKSLLPCQDMTLGGIRFDWLFHPSSFIGGDIFNFFQIDDYQTGFYLLDVVGHGVSAAMRSVTISQVLSMGANGIFLKNPSSTFLDFTSPAKLVRELNLYFQSAGDLDEHFTMVYGVFDRRRNCLTFTQAGHPYPIYVKENEAPALLGQGGFSVGMFSDVDYEEVVVDFQEGDRLCIYSDGIPDCLNKDNLNFSTERLRGLMQSGKEKPVKNLLTDLERDLRTWRGDDQFDDDISCLLLEAM